MSTIHPVQWQSPQPLWSRFGGATAPDQARPAILRFATDDFMERVIAQLERDPSRLDAFVARPETWRKPMDEPASLMLQTPIPRLAAESARRKAASLPKAAVAASAPQVQAVQQAQAVTLPLKLFQPAHQRFYLAAGSLVCGIAGLPERAVVPGPNEQLGMVLRRLVPASAGGELREHAYVKDAQGTRWQRVGDGDMAARLAPGEEQLPVFPLRFADDGGSGRTLWAGLIPVGRREEYIAATVDATLAPTLAQGQQQAMATPASPAPALSKLARVTQFQSEVAEPWKNLIRSAFSTSASLTAAPVMDSESEKAQAKRTRAWKFNLAQQTASWLVLLDLSDYLEAYLPDLWATIAGHGSGYGSLNADRKSIYDWLGTAAMSPALQAGLKATDASAEVRPPSASIRDALLAIRAPGVRAALERTELSYTSDDDSLKSAEWPPFHFLLAGVNNANGADGPFTMLGTPPSALDFDPDPTVGAVPGQAEASKVDWLTALVGRALQATQETDAPPLPFALQLKNSLAANANLGDAGWFALRFVYLRRDCGPLHAPTLSAPTQRFQLANFFDPDAPARPVRITLPLDTSVAGLRKHSRNTAFVLSDMLCGQVQRAKGLGLGDLIQQVLPFPLHKDLNVGSGGSCKTSGGLNIGMICSLSIPIITICALILLFVIVLLLDFVFCWLPFFVLCFPVPGLKGKK